LDQSTHLIKLAPEIGLLHGEGVHHILPLSARGVVVFQQVVIVEIRTETAFDNERREFVDQQIALAVVKPHAYPFIDQGLNQTRGAFGQYQVL
jgi:hypothetical protein